MGPRPAHCGGSAYPSSRGLARRGRLRPLLQSGSPQSERGRGRGDRLDRVPVPVLARRCRRRARMPRRAVPTPFQGCSAKRWKRSISRSAYTCCSAGGPADFEGVDAGARPQTEGRRQAVGRPESRPAADFHDPEQILGAQAQLRADGTEVLNPRRESGCGGPRCGTGYWPTGRLGSGRRPRL